MSIETVVKFLETKCSPAQPTKSKDKMTYSMPLASYLDQIKEERRVIEDSFSIWRANNGGGYPFPKGD